MRTIVAGSVFNRCAIERTLSSTYSLGCSRIGRMISWRLTLSRSMRSGRLGVGTGARCVFIFMARENCAIQGWMSTSRSAVRQFPDQEIRGHLFLLFGCGGFARQPRRGDRLQEGHHSAKLRSELLDQMRLFAMARRQKIRAA